MEKIKIHQVKKYYPYEKTGLTYCGRIVKNTKLAFVPELVTCKNCLKVFDFYKKQSRWYRRLFKWFFGK